MLKQRMSTVAGWGTNIISWQAGWEYSFQTRVCRLVQRENPPIGWFKVNADEACKTDSGLAYSGGIICDHRGELMAGLARNIGRCTMTEAELWVVYDELQQAWFCGTRRVVLEVDGLVVVNLRCNSFDSQHSNALAVGGDVAYLSRRQQSCWRNGEYDNRSTIF